MCYCSLDALHIHLIVSLLSKIIQKERESERSAHKTRQTNLICHMDGTLALNLSYYDVYSTYKYLRHTLRIVYIQL